jgi:hypothetical protein
MRYGKFTIQTRGNGFTALVKRDDGAEVFLQGDDAGIFLDKVEEYGEYAEEYISEYFEDEQ